ncbi:hypothetical protein NDU88_004859 [Pleurodeles waltl]|uniref:Uncharacterized protein n=1 Tax=Pleurodeles waltl TaxID=8319 RepID=A0AAV7T8T2_PLEWA|nr:hypothetical protein NDU88_004859 [Pleurodeles waltl]
MHPRRSGRKTPKGRVLDYRSRGKKVMRKRSPAGAAPHWKILRKKLSKKQETNQPSRGIRKELHRLRGGTGFILSATPKMATMQLAGKFNLLKTTTQRQEGMQHNNNNQLHNQQVLILNHIHKRS